MSSLHVEQKITYISQIFILYTSNNIKFKFNYRLFNGMLKKLED
jgi:hypothetical protein